MTKIYLQQNKKKKNWRKIWTYILAGVLILSVYSDDARLVAIKVVSTAVFPLFKIGAAVSEKSNILFAFKSKKKLTDENIFLKERNTELENKLVLAESWHKENEELKSFFSQTNKKEYILGTIISRPPQSPYDVIIIDAGLENGVNLEMRVMADSSVLIGSIAEVFPKISKVKLVSYPGQETNVLVGDSDFSSISNGLGGGNMEIKIPSLVTASSGDKITTSETFPLLIGRVEKIESSDIDPFQKIFFRLPVNLNELKNVMIEK